MMSRSMRFALAALATVLAVAGLGGTASASRTLRVENPLVIATGNITINEVLGARITCAITLRAMLNAQINKAGAGRLPEGAAGMVERVETAACRDNIGFVWTVIFLTPIALRYESFTGTLPEITGILLTALRAGVRITSASGMSTCLLQGDLPFELTSRAEVPGRLIQKRYLANRLRRIEGNCGINAEIEITGTLEVARTQPILTLA